METQVVRLSSGEPRCSRFRSRVLRLLLLVLCCRRLFLPSRRARRVRLLLKFFRESGHPGSLTGFRRLRCPSNQVGRQHCRRSGIEWPILRRPEPRSQITSYTGI
ncbi:hypothetical protein NDU88_001582 [Pleurodeles waltl]|uniref:Uncharacterized protein n=1 Tax=Pleurodeles waltl TaxID=8319 RepID=A0AAV7Q7K8_PLEWA|nr:hypothetical protein NDU88_001582 [Pleurodeles waltl]